MTWPGPWFRPEHPLTGTVTNPIHCGISKQPFSRYQRRIEGCVETARDNVRKLYISLQHLLVHSKSHHRLQVNLVNSHLAEPLKSPRRFVNCCGYRPKLWCTNNQHCSWCEEETISEEKKISALIWNLHYWEIKKDDENWNRKSDSQHFEAPPQNGWCLRVTIFTFWPWCTSAKLFTVNLLVCTAVAIWMIFMGVFMV